MKEKTFYELDEFHELGEIWFVHECHARKTSAGWVFSRGAGDTWNGRISGVYMYASPSRAKTVLKFQLEHPGEKLYMKNGSRDESGPFRTLDDMMKMFDMAA